MVIYSGFCITCLRESVRSSESGNCRNPKVQVVLRCRCRFRGLGAKGLGRRVLS